MNRYLKQVLGEAEPDEGLIPDDAEDLYRSSEVVGKPLKKIASVVKEPSEPQGDKERYMTPMAALTAPDCTPEALQPLDPSAVPSASKTSPSKGPERFTAKDLEQAEQLPSADLGAQDPAVKTMDLLLGRKRFAPSSPIAPGTQPSMESLEGQAKAMVENMSLGGNALVEGSAKAYATAALTAGQGMPDPTPPAGVEKASSMYRQFI